MSTPGIKPTSTLENLQSAFHGETNANAKYTLFAKKADEKGFHQVASLFRAAARAEQIHAENHARVIRKMRTEPVAKIDRAEVKSTRENLETALAGEVYERDKMYPIFIHVAESQNNTAAIRTFEWALEAEKEHARLFADALNNLEHMKVQTTYYVCAACGYTVEKLGFDHCPVCNLPGERFEEVR